MKYDINAKQELSLAQARTQRTLADITARFDLENLDAISAVTLSERVAEQMKALPPESRRAAIVSSALALADLKELCETLGAHLEEVGGEIRRLKSHNAAATAYRRGRKAMAGSR